MKYRFTRVLWGAVIAAFVCSSAVDAQTQRSPQMQRNGRSTQKANGTVTGPDVLINFQGSLVLNTSKKLSVSDAESDQAEPNILDFFIAKKIEVYDGDKKLKTSDLKVGTPVKVEARRLLDGSMEAVIVHVDHGEAKAAK